MSQLPYSSAPSDFSWISSRVAQIAFAIFGFRLAIFLMPAFNDFPFSSGHFSRSPSYYGVLLFVPLALACLWKPVRLSQMSTVLRVAAAFLATVFISSLVNFIRYSSDPAAMMYLMTMVQNCIVFTMEICIALATRSLIVSGFVSFEAVARIVRASIGLIVIYCCYEILAYYSNIGFFHDSLKAIEPYIHGVTTLNPMTEGTTEQPGSRVRGLSMEPSYFAAVFAFAIPILVYNCIKSRKKIDYLIAFLFAVMIYIGGARTAIMAAVAGGGLIAILLALGRGRVKLVIAGIICSIGALAAAAVLLPVQEIIMGSIDLSPTKFSNIMRLGGAIAAFRLSMDHIFFGVGPGLTPYFVGAYYPDFVFAGPVADLWFDPSRKAHETFSGVARVFSDMGGISLLCYLAMWFTPIYLCSRIVVRQLRREGTVNYQGLALALMLMGQFQASITIEPTTFVGYWIALGMAMAFIESTEGCRQAMRKPS